MSEVTRILNAMESGEAGAAEELLPLVYEELRRLAASKVAQEKHGQTLQATALVHEAWLKLMGENHTWESRRHFIRAAAEAMRRILVDRARQKLSQKRSGQLQRIPIEEIDVAVESDGDLVLRVHEALEELTLEHPDQAELVQLRFFVGMRIPDAAGHLGLSPTTAKRMWILARAWLLNRLSTG